MPATGKCRHAACRMQRPWIIDHGGDSGALQMVDDRLAPRGGHAHRVLRPNAGERLGPPRYDGVCAQRFVIAPRDSLSRSDLIGEYGKLFDQDRGLDRVEAPVQANAVSVICGDELVGTQRQCQGGAERMAPWSRQQRQYAEISGLQIREERRQHRECAAPRSLPNRRARSLLNSASQAQSTTFGNPAEGPCRPCDCIWESLHGACGEV